jgi:hypothetical protein
VREQKKLTDGRLLATRSSPQRSSFFFVAVN